MQAQLRTSQQTQNASPMPPCASARIPVEVWEAVLSLLDDTHDLHSTALVCRAWRDRSQYLIWNELDMALSEIKLMFHLFRFPHLGRLVESACITQLFEVAAADVLPHIIFCLPNLRRLTIAAFSEPMGLMEVAA